MIRRHGFKHPIHSPRRQLFWGAAMIASGAALLLAGQGFIPHASAWLLLPILIGVSALTRLVFARQAQQFARAGLGLALALWLYACITNQWGCTFSTTWPVAVIYLGLSMLTHRRHAFRAPCSGERA
ncbi:LiaF transmembrane domain-containing protein [Niveibacterium terrae]|uniref:LiaF transmembrane domain-containing protein n=1 Tax=Niveibacterium terrae TaxID=3373598 RepID=UPI003A8D972C